MLSSSLLDAAIDQFGRLGFEGASTRAIARASGTAMSSITYHFGGKQGLYLAAAEHIAQAIRELQAPALAAARGAAGGSRRDAAIAMADVLDSFAAMMLRPETEGWARFIIREQQFPTEAFDRLYAGAMAAIVDVALALVRTARPDLEDADARATGLLLVGQALVLRAGRASVTRVLGIETIDEPAAALLRARLRANALCILSETVG
ncbi:CerR family C-terminal domain-containing protein [Sphingomonas sp. MMS12-HWE2-04]|uniref:CerR family C-terminal domain-containing protein n=1 Tax=Sphingomonas sp. MMS12-HWE2-04 TaxID=3234199 RepID=UPI00384DB445